MGDLVQDHLGTDRRKMIIDPLPLGDIPFQEADQGIAATEVRGQCRPGDADKFFADRIGIVGDHHPAPCPDDPIEIRDGSLDVQSAAIGANRLAYCSPLVVNTRSSQLQKPRPTRSTMIGGAPEGEGLELALGDHDRQLWIV